MFKNIKNFIRQGRQARENQNYGVTAGASTSSSHSTIIPSDTSESLVNSQQQDTISIDQKKTNTYNYNEIASQLVQEELKIQNTKFPGLEHYKLIDKIGEGAFSTVHNALNLLTNELVAIKVIKKQQLDSKQKTAVLKEVTIMKQLNQDNIVKFIEFKEVDNFYYIIQELVEGGEIFNEIVKFTYFSEDLTRHVIKQVAEAIKYLHEEVGVVHRDIKPENLLFQPIEITPSKYSKLRKSDDPNKLDEGEFVSGIGGGGIGIVKLADFGLSKQIWLDDTKTPCGTVGYTAPEIVRDQNYSKEVDMWALGCVLYTLLCGFPPFYDEKVDVLTDKVARGEFQFLRPWWDEISDGAKNCVKNLLTVDPRRRYTINQFLNDPWLNQVQFKKPRRMAVHENYKRSNSSYSPAARAMKDAFDISNEIHRVGEESLLKKRNFADLGNDDIIEEEEDAIENASHPKTADLETSSGRYLKQVPLSSQHQNNQRLANHRRHLNEDGDNNGLFELKLDTSTIINRRKKKLLN